MSTLFNAANDANDANDANGQSPQPVDLAHESVAGEEDPGAALDMPAAQSAAQPFAAGAGKSGDEAPEGTPGTAEGMCRGCGGSGRISGSVCQACAGSGRVNVGLAGG